MVGVVVDDEAWGVVDDVASSSSGPLGCSGVLTCPPPASRFRAAFGELAGGAWRVVLVGVAGFGVFSRSRSCPVAVDLAERVVVGSDRVGGRVGTRDGLCDLAWVVSALVSWQGGVTHCRTSPPSL